MPDRGWRTLRKNQNLQFSTGESLPNFVVKKKPSLLSLEFPGVLLTVLGPSHRPQNRNDHAGPGAVP